MNILQAAMTLEALVSGDNLNHEGRKALDTIMAALDAGQAQPVAWYYVEDPWGANEWHWMTDSPESQGCDPRNWTPVYASPPARQPLTDEQIAEAIGSLHDTTSWLIVEDITRAIERAHGIT